MFIVSTGAAGARSPGVFGRAGQLFSVERERDEWRQLTGENHLSSFEWVVNDCRMPLSFVQVLFRLVVDRNIDTLHFQVSLFSWFLKNHRQFHFRVETAKSLLGGLSSVYR